MALSRNGKAEQNVERLANRHFAITQAASKRRDGGPDSLHHFTEPIHPALRAMLAMLAMHATRCNDATSMVR
jgi:hypothetical protein